MINVGRRIKRPQYLKKVVFVCLFFCFRGDDFRMDYSRLAMLCATFPSVPVVALTATASKNEVVAIKQSLNLKTPLQVLANPNRANIYYDKVVRKGDVVDFYEGLLTPIADQLREEKVECPLTVMYLPLQWCGFAFKFFGRLGVIAQGAVATWLSLETHWSPQDSRSSTFSGPLTTVQGSSLASFRCLSRDLL